MSGPGVPPYPDAPLPASRADRAARVLRLGLVLVTLPVALLVVVGIGVFVAAATSDSDAGGYAGLFALAFLGPAVLASPVPILGWALRRRAPQASAAVVLVGGLIVCVLLGSSALGPLLVEGQPWWTALPGVLALALGLTTAWAGIRALVLL